MEGRAVNTGTNTARSAAPEAGAPASAERQLVVAIDGPSGSGKSSVSKEVARRFGLAYLDTGAMYRALTWWCLDRGVDLSDGGAVVEAARSFPLAQGTDPDRELVFVGGTDVGVEIRGARVTDGWGADAETDGALSSSGAGTSDSTGGVTGSWVGGCDGSGSAGGGAGRCLPSFRHALRNSRLTEKST